ncbi:uncharacterized protein BO95DRAFT_272301 [Aspergillus brunneoviolaceus CBS 621.78]|uniref:Uncharacterized protein n=1 Tax=Aspergillus brunneoviolaceus CBS 621.78 TaxID=1450534 RepID=A0ACD1FWN3_9EURO|nr:hypothetical protein BO95DRAFT_272301 [Aspergillus brunneoviolaceus CBS 621.78]RAH41379.1 hypothetical protein BO95DRAFT_272301 [Aspergillus brunneoviolaceus CBS 621.78]
MCIMSIIVTVGAQLSRWSLLASFQCAWDGDVMPCQTGAVSSMENQRSFSVPSCHCSIVGQVMIDRSWETCDDTLRSTASVSMSMSMLNEHLVS